jgi:hypothetical protein
MPINIDIIQIINAEYGSRRSASITRVVNSNADLSGKKSVHIASSEKL